MPIFNLWIHSMCPYKFYYSSLPALGIEAASFVSVVYGASKDIAESPTACRNALLLKFTINSWQFTIDSLQLTVDNWGDVLFSILTYFKETCWCFKIKSVSKSKFRVFFLSLQINNFNQKNMITIENCKELCKRIESLRRYLWHRR